MDNDSQTPPAEIASAEQVSETPVENNQENFYEKNKKLLFLGIGILLLLLITLFYFSFLQKQKSSNPVQNSQTPTPTPSVVPSVSLPFETTPTPIASPTATFVPDQLIIQYNLGQTPEDLNSERNSQIKVILDQIGVISQEKLYTTNDATLRTYYMLKFKKGTDLEGVKKILDTIPEVKNAEQNNIITTED